MVDYTLNSLPPRRVERSVKEESFLETLAVATEFSGLFLPEKDFQIAAKELLARAPTHATHVPMNSFAFSFGSDYFQRYGLELRSHALTAEEGVVVIGLLPGLLGYMLHFGDGFSLYTPELVSKTLARFERHYEGLMMPFTLDERQQVVGEVRLGIVNLGADPARLRRVERLFDEVRLPEFVSSGPYSRQNRRLPFRGYGSSLSLPSPESSELHCCSGVLSARCLLPRVRPPRRAFPRLLRG